MFTQDEKKLLKQRGTYTVLYNDLGRANPSL